MAEQEESRPGGAAPSDQQAADHPQYKPATDIPAGIAASSALRIPSLPDDVLGAALAYAGAGWYVLPVDGGTKDAGSVLHTGWPAKTSRDPDVIASWFAGTDYGLALHMGRSGAVGFDVDHPEVLPAELPDLFRPAPFQSTRLTEPGRGHYVFAVPAGRSFRNSNGTLGSGWGEVRGRNGIVVVEPTAHSKPGGRYLWTSRGVLPVLPETLAGRLVEHGGTDEDTATDAEVKAWMAAHPIGSRPGRVKPILGRYRTESAGSRHQALTGCLVWLCKEVNAGYLAAPDALRQLHSAHTAALADPKHRNGADPNRKDFWGVLAWAVAQAASDPLIDGMNGSATTIQAVSGASQIASAASEPAPEGDPAAHILAPAVADAFDAAVADEAQRLRVREAARRQVAAETAEVAELPPLQGLRSFLDVPDEDATHRVAGLWPTGGRVVLSAQHKAGKSTMVGNLIRSLVDGDAFLGQFATQPARRVLLIDDELDPRMLRRWLRDQRISNADAVELIPLRGQLSTFDILDPAHRQRWALHLGSADVLLFDCLRPALDALGLSEDKDAGRFLESLDELTTAAGIGESLVVHHMGHNGERSRGDSRILDWPDAVWNLVKGADDDDDEQPRKRKYFSAYGRDVEQPETLLAYDPVNRHLTTAGGSRKDSRAEGATGDVIDWVRDNPRSSQNSIERGLGKKAEVVRKALRLAIERGEIDREKVGQTYLHTTASHRVPTASGRSSANRVPASIDADADAARLQDQQHPGTRTQLGQSAATENYAPQRRAELDSTDAEKPVKILGLQCGDHPDRPAADCFACAMVVQSA